MLHHPCPAPLMTVQHLPTTAIYCQLPPTIAKTPANYCQLVPTTAKISANSCQRLSKLLPSIANFDQLLPKHLPAPSNYCQHRYLITSTPRHTLSGGVVFWYGVFDTSGLPAILLESCLSIEMFRQRKWKHPTTQSAIGQSSAKLPNRQRGFRNNWVKRCRSTHREVSQADLESALRIVAEVISFHGEAYLPLFIRLRDELEQKKNQDTALQEALRLARDN